MRSRVFWYTFSDVLEEPAPNMEAERTSKIVVIVYQITMRHIQEENNFHNRRLDVMKSHILK